MNTTGYTDLNKLFDEDDTGNLYIETVGWDDCPHMTPDIQQQLLAGIPEWQRDMRCKGLPVLGSGAVFPYKDSDITIDDVYILPHWRVVAGVDFGMTTDPSTIVYSAYDPDNDMYYIFKEFLLDEDLEARTPTNMSRVILSSDIPNIPVVVP